jgi:hypothetical protein
VSARLVLLNAWMLLPPVLLLVPLGGIALREAVASVLALPWWLRVTGGRQAASRPAAVASVGILAGLLLTQLGWTYVLRNLSAADVFERYRNVAVAAEPLAVMSLNPQLAVYAGATAPQPLATAADVSGWLTMGGQRRWAALRSDELAAVNAEYRRLKHENLPVFGEATGAALLATNLLPKGERDGNPLSLGLPRERPRLAVDVEGEFAGQLRVLGLEWRDRRGRPVASLSAGRSYQLTMAFEVLAPVRRDWQLFVHLEARGFRINGDHPPLQDRYPTHHWAAGDYVVDEHEVAIARDAPPGRYELLFGWYAGQQRLEVTRGERSGDRLHAGAIYIE